MLRRHCETNQRSNDAIEKTNVIGLLLARDEAALRVKHQRLAVPEPFQGFAGTVSQMRDLADQYRDAGVQLLISSAFKNDAETHELLASDGIPQFT